MLAEATQPVPTGSLIAFVVGCALSPLLARLILFLAEDRNLALPIACTRCERQWSWFASLRSRKCDCGDATGWWPLLLTLWTGALLAVFYWLYFTVKCQDITEVRPPDFWLEGRFYYHAFLFVLLTIAIGTDLRNYTISDPLVIVGIVVGVGLATLSGHLQTIHIWVDWNDLMVERFGPYLPDWMSKYQRLHGLAWSLTGLVVGAGVTWLLRTVAQFVLQRPALGMGDVTLMAMVGSYVGWQPVVLIMLLAPLLAIVIGLAVWITTGRAFVAYGPYLALAAIVVLCSWRWIWVTDLRYTFGHARSLAILGGAAAGTLIVLLVGLRLYQMIPTGTENAE